MGKTSFLILVGHYGFANENYGEQYIIIEADELPIIHEKLKNHFERYTIKSMLNIGCYYKII